MWRIRPCWRKWLTPFLHSRAEEGAHARDRTRCTLTKGTTRRPTGRLCASEGLHLALPAEEWRAARNWGGTDGLWSARSHGSTASVGWLYVMSDDWTSIGLSFNSAVPLSVGATWKRRFVRRSNTTAAV